MRLFTGLFALVVLAASLAELPLAFDFTRFAFGDAGWALTANQLLDEGLVPTKDFAYFYGLLTLSVNRAVFTICGTSPWTVGGLFVACAAIGGFGVWRLVRSLGVGVWPRVVLLLLLPLMTNPGNFPSPAHAMESVLLIHALASQAGGRLASALALCTLAVCVKPGLAYFLGLMLVLQTLLAPGVIGRWRRLLPATFVGLAVLAYLSATFGLDAVLRTQIPLDASKEYRELNNGFFHGDGQAFWKPQAGRPRLYYFLSPAGVWLATSVVTVVGGLIAAFRVRSDPAARTMLTVAVLHVVFVGFLFGNRFSWFYYPYLPFVGAVLALDRLPRWLSVPELRWPVGAVGTVVALLAAFAVSMSWLVSARMWQTTVRDPQMGGLFAARPLAEVWPVVQARAAEGRVFVLTRMGCASALVPGIESPRVWCMSRAVASPGDWERFRAGITRCQWLLVPAWFDNPLLTWPELADDLAPFEKPENGPGFTVYRRRTSPGR